MRIIKTILTFLFMPVIILLVMMIAYAKGDELDG